jgi:hypothetical protein
MHAHDIRQDAAPPVRATDRTSVLVAVATAICAIPLTAIAASLGDVAGLVAIIVVWIGLVAVNVAHARANRA